MADHLTVVVYLRADDVRGLRERGEDPKLWVRGLVKDTLAAEGAQHEYERLVATGEIQTRGSEIPPEPAAGKRSYEPDFK